MNKVTGYDAYGNSYQNYDACAASKAHAKSAALSRPEQGSAAKQVELSSEAKDVLKELQQKYGNMDFIIADCSTDEEAAEYLSRGTKEYSVLLSAEELEKMAKDESVKEDYMDKIESARDQLADIRSQLGEAGETVKKLGVKFEDDGTTSLFASLEKAGDAQRERIEEAKAAKQADKVAEKNAASQKVKRTSVTAKSTEELLEEIRSVDWDQIKEEEIPAAGGRFDIFG